MATDADKISFLNLMSCNRALMAVLERLPHLGLADYWVTGGCLCQSVWNALYGNAPDYGILDYDIVYYHADTSWDGEDRIIRRGAALFADLPVDVQIRNQARVPLWYKEKTGLDYLPISQASDGIDGFPCATMVVGARKAATDWEFYAPLGLSNALRGILRPNRRLNIPEVYAIKTARWKATWPQLTLVLWNE